MTLSWLSALNGRTDLIYGSNNLLLFALEIGLGMDDIHTVAASALTDGPDDKKCDLLYVDRDAGRAVIAQSYVSADTTKSEAKASKAADLNTAVSWLLSQDFAEMPNTLEPAAKELDAALEDGDVETLEIWYVHNLPESENVWKELSQVRKTADSMLQRYYRDTRPENVHVLEVGQQTLASWYKSISAPIVVSEKFDVPISAAFRTTTEEWDAVTTSVPATWLHSLFENHREDLFSANLRGYLGSRKSDKNINHNMKETARTKPLRFWAYNNGITALVNEVILKKSESGTALTIEGISVVNGAQTVGAIGSVDSQALGDAEVLARFVKCPELAIVEEIIRFNNSQNKLEPSDFRSNDRVQERLRKEFEEFQDVHYTGGRRGSYEDKIRRPANVIPSYTAGQALAAFHQDPYLAYNHKSRIWEEDGTYAKYFNDQTTAGHILLVYSLQRCIEECKSELSLVPESNRADTQTAQIQYLRGRGAVYLLCSAIAGACEQFVSGKIADRFSLKLSSKESIASGMKLWKPIVVVSLAFVRTLQAPIDAQLKRADNVRSAIDDFVAMIEATKDHNQEIYRQFSDSIEHS